MKIIAIVGLYLFTILTTDEKKSSNESYSKWLNLDKETQAWVDTQPNPKALDQKAIVQECMKYYSEHFDPEIYQIAEIEAAAYSKFDDQVTIKSQYVEIKISFTLKKQNNGVPYKAHFVARNNGEIKYLGTLPQ